MFHLLPVQARSQWVSQIWCERIQKSGQGEALSRVYLQSQQQGNSPLWYLNEETFFEGSGRHGHHLDLCANRCRGSHLSRVLSGEIGFRRSGSSSAAPTSLIGLQWNRVFLCLLWLCTVRASVFANQVLLSETDIARTRVNAERAAHRGRASASFLFVQVQCREALPIQSQRQFVLTSAYLYS